MKNYAALSDDEYEKEKKENRSECKFPQRVFDKKAKTQKNISVMDISLKKIIIDQKR